SSPIIVIGVSIVTFPSYTPAFSSNVSPASVSSIKFCNVFPCAKVVGANTNITIHIIKTTNNFLILLVPFFFGQTRDKKQRLKILPLINTLQYQTYYM